MKPLANIQNLFQLRISHVKLFKKNKKISDFAGFTNISNSAEQQNLEKRVCIWVKTHEKSLQIHLFRGEFVTH